MLDLQKTLSRRLFISYTLNYTVLAVKLLKFKYRNLLCVARIVFKKERKMSPRKKKLSREALNTTKTWHEL